MGGICSFRWAQQWLALAWQQQLVLGVLLPAPWPFLDPKVETHVSISAVLELNRPSAAQLQLPPLTDEQTLARKHHFFPPKFPPQVGGKIKA